MNNKENQDNSDNQHNNDLIKWRSLGFFSAEDYLIYIFKKTEKITAALYLVTGLLTDDEPMKWELRDRGMDLLTSSFTASSTLPGDKNTVIQSLFTAALETISLLNVGKISNLISEMNHTVLVKEIDQVVGLLRDRLAQNAENAGYVLSESFFKTPSLFSSGFRSDQSVSQSKGHIGQSQQQKETQPSQKGQIDIKDKKNERRERILELLKKKSKLTIKDFTQVIKDCSEKTIQRELIELVDQGIVARDGERRWSTYSLR